MYLYFLTFIQFPSIHTLQGYKQKKAFTVLRHFFFFFMYSTLKMNLDLILSHLNRLKGLYASFQVSLHAKTTMPDSQPVSDKHEEDIVFSLGLKVFISDNFMSMFYCCRNAHVKNPKFKINIFQNLKQSDLIYIDQTKLFRILL